MLLILTLQCLFPSAGHLWRTYNAVNYHALLKVATCHVCSLNALLFA